MSDNFQELILEDGQIKIITFSKYFGITFEYVGKWIDDEKTIFSGKQFVKGYKHPKCEGQFIKKWYKFHDYIFEEYKNQKYYYIAEENLTELL